MIKVNNLSKEFHEQGTSNELLAVDHVDFTIQNGSFCALVGESGSGKSTLAQLMCGLLVPSSARFPQPRSSSHARSSHPASAQALQ